MGMMDDVLEDVVSKSVSASRWAYDWARTDHTERAHAFSVNGPAYINSESSKSDGISLWLLESIVPVILNLIFETAMRWSCMFWDFFPL
jgi:hypothetical protein